MLALLESTDQAFRLWAAGLGWPIEAFLRLALAAVAGGLVGLEREIRGRQAGFRTMLLVCLGSALVMIVSTRFADMEWIATNPGLTVTVDPARIAYGVMTGVGFLGAGTIIQHRGSIRGLTTAAALWCVAAIGLAMGLGLYTLCGLTVLLVVVSLWLLDYAENILPKKRYRLVTLRRLWAPGCVRETVKLVKNAGLEVQDSAFQRSDDLTQVDISLSLGFLRTNTYLDFEHLLENDPRYELLSVREI